MSMTRPSEIELAELKGQYTGKRIRLILMTRDLEPIEPGTQGTCLMVDDAGQLVMKWDNGRTLSLLPGVDQFELLPITPLHECKMSDLVRCPKPAQGPDSETVTFNLKCRVCGTIFQEIYVVMKGLWNGISFVELE
jgi:hypothetical protein